MSVSRPLIFAVIDAPASVLGVSAPEKSVLVALVSHLNSARNGVLVWPSQQRLAEMTGLGASTVRRVLVRLEALGLIKRQESGSRHNVYAVQREVIHDLCDTARSERYNPSQNGDSARSERSIPLGASANTARSERLTTKEQPNRTAYEFDPFGCSANLKVSAGDQQRKMALVGLVDQAIDGMRPDTHEWPKVEKTGGDAA